MKTSLNKTRGFTLMESVIAIGVVAILLSTFLAVFGPASASIRRAISAQDAERLQSALERELQVLRESDKKPQINTAFDKAYDWILESGKSASAVLLYNYRGDPDEIKDGRLGPYTGEGGQSGRDFIIQPSVRRIGDDDPGLWAEIEQVEGRVFYVRMTQLVFENGALKVSDDPDKISDPHSPGTPIGSAEDYPEAVIAFSADFYVLKSSAKKYIEALDFSDGDGNGRPDTLGTPLFTRNLGVRR